MKIYTIDNGTILRVRIDEAAKIAYVSDLREQHEELPGYNDYMHNFAEYYAEHNDVLNWTEIALPYKKIFPGVNRDKYLGEREKTVCVLLEIDTARVPSLASLENRRSGEHEIAQRGNHLYAFIGGDINYFSLHSEIVRFACELGNSASLDAFAFTRTDILYFVNFNKIHIAPLAALGRVNTSNIQSFINHLYMEMDGDLPKQKVVHCYGYERDSDKNMSQIYSDSLLKKAYLGKSIDAPDYTDGPARPRPPLYKVDGTGPYGANYVPPPAENYVPPPAENYVPPPPPPPAAYNRAENYYNILGVPNNASNGNIRSAYRGLAKIHHPDKGGDEETFKRIGRAYEILTTARAAYNATRRGGSRRHIRRKTYRSSRRVRRA